MSAAEVQKIAKLTVDTLKGMRSDDAFKLFFKLVESIREKTDTEEASLPRKRKEPRRLEVGYALAYYAQIFTYSAFEQCSK